jgi:hypothetical protein
MWVLNSIVEGVLWVGNWLWDEDFVDWSVSDNWGVDDWSVVVGQWLVDWAGSHSSDEESGNNEALWSERGGLIRDRLVMVGGDSMRLEEIGKIEDEICWILGGLEVLGTDVEEWKLQELSQNAISLEKLCMNLKKFSKFCWKTHELSTDFFE